MIDSTFLAEIDPCWEGKKTCDEHSSCVVEGDNFRCICNPGYHLVYSEFDSTQKCVDENECLIGSHKCDKNAACFNDEGSYHCQCNPGYRGDGRNCEKQETCEDIHCDENADCIETPLRKPECRCKPGFRGNGFQCIAVTQEVGCDVVDNCSKFASCSYNEVAEQYLCSCLKGFIGDGITCQEVTTDDFSSGPPQPTCFVGSCWCPQGYQYDGRDGCLETPLIEDSRENPEEVSCNTVNMCHPNAQCVYVPRSGIYQCQCNAGYEGDGQECTESEISCKDVDICDLHATCTFDTLLQKAICVCKPGYQGDGERCYAVDECRFSYDCGENAQCLYNKETQRHECVCSLGFLGDGKSCHPNEDTAECTTHADCHPDAACAYDTEKQSFICRCNQDFSGDGKSCSPIAVSCHILNNCGPNADCMYDIQESGYRCKCREGFEGDGFTCQKDSSCQHDATVCHEKASCVPSRGTYFCQCNEGYVGNGLQCKAVSRHEGNFLLVNQGMSTLRVPFNPTASNPGQPIQIHYFQVAVGIDIDCQEGRVYWSDVNGRTIKSSKYDGSDIQIFLDTDIGSPEGLSIDWVSRNIYWTDSTKDTVEVASLETKVRRVLISDGLVNPRGIVVHPAKGKMYWTDWNREGPKIETANLDGSQRSIFLQGSVQLPNSLTFDYDRDELCWPDAGNKKIECMGVYSLVRRTVMSNCSYPFGLTMSKRNYYWTDWITQKIESSPRPEGELNKSIDVPLGGSGKIYGVVAVPEQCPQMYNLCQYETSPCPEGHLCLPNGRGGRSCVCGIKDGEDPSSCNDAL
ncbi:hypothetical protein J437_LFUL001582 [Ladona fulva]|uniref:EGF-like domain-containing protein n=1 Tax=Ladona fulva TaxID=123851 RepID=A0A8K0P8P9_LADFU|nr:hypothetical protein J437_LFUL001582 [Ladona fulva]